jgi:nucleoside-triphosphatase
MIGMDMTTPHDDPLFSLSESGKILVVGGKRGAGKTTYCQNAVAEYRKAGLKVAGLLSPGRFENGQKNGIFAVDLVSRESRLAASPISGEISDGIRFGAWTFDRAVFAWGNRCLRQSSGSDVLVIDELGYLEFDLNSGWTAGFEVLHAKNYRLALVVIRPECIEPFANLGFNFQMIFFSV